MPRISLGQFTHSPYIYTMTLEGCVELCPGCRYRGYSEKESNEKKQAWAERCLEPFAPVRPILSPEDRYGYRRKAMLHAELGEDGWKLGLLRRRGWEADLIEIPDCPLHTPALNDSFRALKAELDQRRDLPLAFVLASGSIFTLVLKCKESSDLRAWAAGTRATLQQHGVEGLQLNWNPSAGRRPVSSRHQEVVFGPRFAFDGELFFGALSFRQQLPALEARALEAAKTFLEDLGGKNIVDLYCGAGATLRQWQALGWASIGVELSGEAISAAKLNAPAAELLTGRCEQRIPQLNEWLAKDARKSEGFVLYTNPPRGGHAPEVNEWILQAAPKGIAYLSCNQKTLAGDLEELGARYEAVSVQPFDFFPQTDHVESLALLRLR